MKKTEENVLRVALLPRVSTEEQVLRGFSLDAQEKALVEYANNNNMKIVGIYRDEGHSARKPVLKRPVMLELLEDVKEGKLDMIIFTKLDRWFRNVSEYHKIQEILERHKVTWKAILEDYNTTTADGRLKVNIMLSVAENEADRTSERIKFVFQSKINKKEVIIPPQCVPFGYKIELIDGIKRLVKDEETREATEYFFSIVLSTSTRNAIIRTQDKYNIHREHKSWYKMCQNEVYIGTYKGVEDYCEPYITKSQFNEINERGKKFREPKNDRTYLFTSLIRCPLCGRRMISKSCVNRIGEEYYYYRCPSTINKSCPTKMVSEKNTEQYVLENVKTELEKFIVSYETSAPKTKKKTTDVAKLKEQLRRVNVSYQLGNMEDAEYISETKKIKALIEKASAEEQNEKPLDLTSLKDFLNSDFEKVYGTLNKREKQRLWCSVIDELIYDGESVVGIKFKA